MSLLNRISREKIAMLHVAKKQLGMNDPEYYAMLSRFGVKHSNELTFQKWPDVLTYLEGLGFVKRRGTKGSGMNKAFAKSKAPLLKKIEAILADMGKSWSYADGIAQNMFDRDRKSVVKLRFCNYDQTRKVLLALVYQQNRG